MKELLIDCIVFDFSKEQLTESVRTGGPLIVKGILQKAGEKNQNGRIYPKEILMREAAKYEENFIKQRRAIGELDHPDQAVVNLKNASHNITEIHWEGDSLIGTIEVLTTPSGNILRELFKNNIRLGISSRGLGSVKPVGQGGDETVEVQDDFELLCWDFVSTPSTRGAFVSPINENINHHLKPSDLKYTKVDTLCHQIMAELNPSITLK
jgi:hypothetical protein